MKKNKIIKRLLMVMLIVGSFYTGRFTGSKNIALYMPPEFFQRLYSHFLKDDFYKVLAEKENELRAFREGYRTAYAMDTPVNY